MCALEESQSLLRQERLDCQDSWDNVLWTDGTKVEIFDQNTDKQKPNSAPQHKDFIATVKHSDLGLFCNQRFGHITVSELNMNSSVY